MAKITAEQLEVAKGWQEFGDRLGWKLVSCTEIRGVFSHPSLERPLEIYMGHRKDIERTWREAEQSNVAPIRSGTDG